MTDGQTFAFDDPVTPGVDDGYAYDSGGRLTKMFYPSSRPVSYEYDNAGRPKSAGGYVTSLSYAAHGAPEHIMLGNGVEETLAYNKRLQVTGVAAAKLPNCLLDLRFYPSIGGTVLGTQDYRYDELNRLKVWLRACQETPGLDRGQALKPVLA